MALYISVDMELLKKNLKKVPLFPMILLYLCWGTSMLKDGDALKRFSGKGLFTEIISDKSEGIHLAS